MSDRSYKIYLHRNKINGKIYIGQTCQELEKRWGRNGIGYKENKLFFNEILEYGWTNFQHETLHSELTKGEANRLEAFYIKVFDTTNPNFGYNLQAGNNKKEEEEIIILKEEQYNNIKTLECKKEVLVSPEVIDTQSSVFMYIGKPIDRLLPGAKLQRVPRLDRAKKGRQGKMVYSPELNLVFETIVDANIFVGLDKSSGQISNACKDENMKFTAGRHPTLGIPLHWRYVESLKNPTEYALV